MLYKMKIVSDLRFALDRVCINKKRAFFSVMIIACLVMLINLVVVDIGKITYIKIKVSDILDEDTENVYRLDFGIDAMFVDNIKEIIDCVNETDGVKGAGMYSQVMYPVKEFANKEDFINLNKEALIEENQMMSLIDSEQMTDLINTYGENSHFLYIDSRISDLCDIKLKDGSMGMQKRDNDNVPVVVGSSYEGLLEIGDTFYVERFKETYQVVGIISEGTEWLTASKLGASESSGLVLDNYIVVMSDCKMASVNINYSACYYVLEESSDCEMVKTEIEKILNGKKIKATIESVQKILDDELGDEKDLIEIYVALFLFLSSIGIVSVATSSIMSVLSNRDNIGIMIVSGFQRWDILCITIIENAIKALLGGIVGFAVSFALLMKNSLPYEKEIVLYLEFPHSFLWVICAVIIISIISTLPPLVMVKRMSLVELIKKKE